MSINRHHGGAIEDCARQLKAIADHAARDSISLEEAATRTLAAMRETGERMSGFGHRLHTKDPRTTRLFELAREAGVDGPHMQAARAVEKAFADAKKSLPINVDGAIGAILADLGLTPAAFTPSAAANLTRNLSLNGTISGAVYAQPLYIEGGPSGPMIIAVTEQNNVYALNATTGTVIWSRTNIGSPVQNTPCGGFNPTGITGTPVVDLASRRLFFDALINGSPTKHFIYSLNVDTGVTTPGWPVDVNAKAVYNGIPFV